MSLFARKVELYEFTFGVAHFLYTAGGRDITVASQTYTHAAIGRGSINESIDVSRNSLDITAPLELPLLDLFRPIAPVAPVGVVVRKYQGTTLSTIWNGEIGSAEFNGSGCTLHCVSPMSSARATGLKRNWQKQCPLVLYSTGLGQCNANKEAVKALATLTGVAGNVIHAAAFAAQADGWWSGGYIEWNDGHILQRRWISSHTGDALTLMTPAAPLIETSIVSVFPGCDHTLATCDSKFNNADNYGGQPWIPEKNPMGSQEVY